VDAPDDRYDLVWFWKQNDSGLYGRRSDKLASALAASPRVHRIVQLDRALTPCELFAGVGPGRHPLRRHENLVLLQTLPRLWRRPERSVLTRHTFLYAGDGARRWLPGPRDYAAWLRRLLRRAGVGGRRTVFWVYPRNLAFPGLVRDLAPSLVVADCVDDQRAWPGASADFVERTAANYREVLARADLVLANCEGMRAALSGLREDIRVLEHGFDAGAGAARRPRALARLPRPIVGYAGNLSARVDVELLRRLALRHPEWSVVLLGYAPRDAAIRSLAALANVHFLGVRREARARDVIRHFDVALLPHADDPLTRTMAPLKLGAYCAGGVPVVATRVANLGPLEAVIDVADDADSFVACVEHALATPPSPERAAKRAEILAAASWSRRADEVIALLDEAWAKRQAARVKRA
jgi:glycosyltransferase involved in cell wall biosynthesis